MPCLAQLLDVDAVRECRTCQAWVLTEPQGNPACTQMQNMAGMPGPKSKILTLNAGVGAGRAAGQPGFHTGAGRGGAVCYSDPKRLDPKQHSL